MSKRTLPMRTLALCILATACSTALRAQNARPPKAQLWIDVSTGTMAGMPEMDMPAGMGGMGGMGGMLGG